MLNRSDSLLFSKVYEEIYFSALVLYVLFSSASIINWFTTKCLKGASEAVVTKEAMVSGNYNRDKAKSYTRSKNKSLTISYFL